MYLLSIVLLEENKKSSYQYQAVDPRVLECKGLEAVGTAEGNKSFVLSWL